MGKILLGGTRKLDGEQRFRAARRPSACARTLQAAAAVAAVACVGGLGFAASGALAQTPPPDPVPTTSPIPDPAPAPPAPKPKPPPPPPPPPPPSPSVVVTPPPPPISPPPPPSAATESKKVERRKPAAGKAAKRKPASTKPARRERTIPKELLDQSRPPPVALPSTPNAAVAERRGDLGQSSAVEVLIIAATALALFSLVLAALPLPTLERLFVAEAHWRAEQVATFVDRHRLDITVAGIAPLLVAIVVALPTVAG